MIATATEALKRAENGEEVIIYQTEMKKKFILTAQLIKPDKMEIVKRMEAIGLKSASPEYIKNIVVSQ